MKIRKSEKVNVHRYRAGRCLHSFQIAADLKIQYVNHKGKITLALVHPSTLEYRTCHIIGPSEALRLIGWLGKYLNTVRPTTVTQNAVSISAHARGIERDKNYLLAAAANAKGNE